MAVLGDEPLTVKVLRLNGEPMEFHLPFDAKISDLKMLLQETCAVPFFCQKLMLRHTFLKNGDPLSSLGQPISSDLRTPIWKMRFPMKQTFGLNELPNDETAIIIEIMDLCGSFQMLK
eukprot:s66_g8.t1